jgi:hypothetical protein
LNTFFLGETHGKNDWYTGTKFSLVQLVHWYKSLTTLRHAHMSYKIAEPFIFKICDLYLTSDCNFAKNGARPLKSSVHNSLPAPLVGGARSAQPGAV